MPLMTQFIDIILHLDRYLAQITQEYGLITYVILFAIIFAETVFVITPFLPGDSLLFAVGALAATDSLNITILFIVLWLAAVLGDTINYSIGFKFGEKILPKEDKFFYKIFTRNRREYNNC